MMWQLHLKGRALTYQIPKLKAVRLNFIEETDYPQLAMSQPIERTGYYIGHGVDADDSGSETYQIVVDSLTGKSLEVSNNSLTFKIQEEEK